MKKYLVLIIFGFTFCFGQDNQPKAGNIFVPADKDEVRVSFTNFGNSSIAYSIANNPVPHDRSKETTFNVRVNGKLLSYKSKPYIIYPGGSPILEGDNIELLRTPGRTKNNAYISYSLIRNFDLRGNLVKGTFAFTNSNGPTLIAKLKRPRTIRIHLVDFLPKVSKSTNYDFIVIVDGVEIRNGTLSNSSSMDLMGMEFAIKLKSWPPTSSGFRVTGTFEVIN